MGIFDGLSQGPGAFAVDTAQAIYESERKLAELQLQAQQMNMQAQSAANALGLANGYGQSYNSSQSAAKQASHGLQRKQNPFNPNKQEAFQIPLSRLVTLWQAKYGDQWINGDEPVSERDDAFYVDALRRLLSAGLFEQHSGWVRLKENVEKLLADR